MAETVWWQRILSWVYPSAEDELAQVKDRLRELNRAVAREPQSAALYVSRGEAYLKGGEIEAAVQDFRQALTLAETQFKTDAWGLVAQSVRDRALQGLTQAQGLTRAARAGSD